MMDAAALLNGHRLSGDARIYMQPAQFVERPHDLDGQVARIADTMLWFGGWQVRIRDGGSTVGETLVPVAMAPDWIGALPDGLAQQAQRQMQRVSAPRGALTMGNRTIRLGEPQIMGILNVTPDSFSDGGKHIDSAAAVAAGVQLSADGAAIVDVGGESTRPGAPVVWEGDEAQRVIPVVEGLARAGVAVSVDSRKAAVMEAALAAGAGMINDISALLYDDRAMGIAQQSDCPIVLMHAPSQKSNPHDNGDYRDVVADVFDWLQARVDAVEQAGIARSRLIVDPGIGFGKGLRENLLLLNALPLFHAIGCPLLVGASRKRLIGALDGEAPAEARLGGSIALHYHAAQAGAQIVRVHDVAPTRQAMRVWRGLRDTALTR